MTSPSRLKSQLLLVSLSMAFNWASIQAQPKYSTKLITDGRLTWADFSGPIDATSKYSATTAWWIGYTYKVIAIQGNQVRLDLQVSTRLKGTSWVIPAKRSDELLAHEQGHFDIARIHALKFRQAVLSTVLIKETYKEKINLVFQWHLVNAKLMGLQYDEETNHSLNRSQQKKWTQKLNGLLLSQ